LVPKYELLLIFVPNTDEILKQLRLSPETRCHKEFFEPKILEGIHALFVSHCLFILFIVFSLLPLDYQLFSLGARIIDHMNIVSSLAY